MTSPETGPFNAGQVAALQSELGSNLDYPDLAARYERLGSVESVIAEVLRIRLADAIGRPTSFAIPGQYSEDRGNSVKLLAERVGVLDAEQGVGEDLVRIKPGPFSRHQHHQAMDTEEHVLRHRRWGTGGR